MFDCLLQSLILCDTIWNRLTGKYTDSPVARRNFGASLEFRLWIRTAIDARATCAPYCISAGAG